MSKLSAIFFDLDDTLCDESRCYRDALQASSRMVRDRLNLGDWIPLYQAYLEVSDRLWEEFDRWGTGLGSSEIRSHVWTAAFAGADIRVSASFVEEVGLHYARERSVRHGWLPGVEMAFRALCGNYRIGLITNGSTDIQREKIERLGLTEHCATVLVGEECGCQKPDRRIFERALNEAGVDAAESLMVGDRPTTDIVGAHAVGMRATWIAPLDSDWPLASPAPWLRLRSVSELPSVLEARGGSSRTQE